MIIVIKECILNNLIKLIVLIGKYTLKMCLRGNNFASPLNLFDISTLY
jgi:hypothetical protein